MEEGPLNDGYWFENRIDRDGETVFHFLSSRFPYRDWEERFAGGFVTVDGIVAPGNLQLRRGNVVRSFRSPWREPPIDRTLAVLADTNTLVVVCKQKGYPVVPHGDFLRHLLLHLVRARHPEAVPLHRLGRGTTGAICFAKNAASARKYCIEFEMRRVHKVRSVAACPIDFSFPISSRRCIDALSKAFQSGMNWIAFAGLALWTMSRSMAVSLRPSLRTLPKRPNVPRRNSPS